MNKINKIYNTLISYFGPQGWWPLFDSSSGKMVYSGKKKLTSDEKFEIILGTILTQNVAWTNVEKCFINLSEIVAIKFDTIAGLSHEKLSQAIIPSGYYNQKTKKIYNIINVLQKNSYTLESLSKLSLNELRTFLLSVKGIGPETADSIALYAYNKKTFVVDAYTKRLLLRLGIIDNEKTAYTEVQEYFHENFKGDVNEYKEFHACIVALAKDFCKKKPQCHSCPLQNIYC